MDPLEETWKPPAARKVGRVLRRLQGDPLLDKAKLHELQEALKNMEAGNKQFALTWASEYVKEVVRRSGKDRIEFFLTNILPSQPPLIGDPADSPIDEKAAHMAANILQQVIANPLEDETEEFWYTRWGTKNIPCYRYDETPIGHELHGVDENQPCCIRANPLEKPGSWELYVPQICADELVRTGIAEFQVVGFPHAMQVCYREGNVTIFDPNFDGLQMQEAKARLKHTGEVSGPGWCALWALFYTECTIRKLSNHDDLLKESYNKNSALPLTTLVHTLGARYIAAIKQVIPPEKWQHVLQQYAELTHRASQATDDQLVVYHVYREDFPTIEERIKAAIIKATTPKENNAFVDTCV